MAEVLYSSPSPSAGGNLRHCPFIALGLSALAVGSIVAQEQRVSNPEPVSESRGALTLGRQIGTLAHIDADTLMVDSTGRRAIGAQAELVRHEVNWLPRCRDRIPRRCQRRRYRRRELGEEVFAGNWPRVLSACFSARAF